MREHWIVEDERDGIVRRRTVTACIFGLSDPNSRAAINSTA